MSTKRRLSASIDAGVLDAAELAVESGRAASVSAWVNEACQRQIDHERRLSAMDDFLTRFEAEFGEITEADIADATRRTRADAIVVRAAPLPRSAPPRRASLPGVSSRRSAAVTGEGRSSPARDRSAGSKRRS